MDGGMAKRHECLNPVIKLYLFFTFSLPISILMWVKPELRKSRKWKARTPVWGLTMEETLA